LFANALIKKGLEARLNRYAGLHSEVILVVNSAATAVACNGACKPTSPCRSLWRLRSRFGRQGAPQKRGEGSPTGSTLPVLGGACGAPGRGGYARGTAP